MIFTDEIDVKLLRFTGSDKDVCNDARTSTNNADYDSIDYLLDQKDIGLINYLMREKHGVPFSGNFFKFGIEAPIFVMRQWMKHSVGWSYNEMSGRYVELQPKFYVPREDRPLIQTGKVGDYKFRAGGRYQYDLVSSVITSNAEQAWAHYQNLLLNGIAKELARTVLPFNTFTKVIASTNARGIMNFLAQRVEDPNATFPSHPQYEISVAASQIEKIFAEKMPVTHGAFVKNGRINP